ncbi:MAG: hypothetical protein ACR2MK_02470 [Solirubrobacteraceae bacterium]
MPAERSGSRRRQVTGRLAALAVLAAGVAGAVGLVEGPGSGHASPLPEVTSTNSRAIESMFQDDRLLIYSPTPTVIQALDALRALGVDRLRVTLLWSNVAPAAASSVRPLGFDASDPAAYPPRAWAPYDRLLGLARARGIEVDLDVTAPGPLWAMRPGAPVARQADHYAPSAADFGEFVLAAGRRYSGTYVPPGAHAPLPRVGYWSVWNEPNQPGWLAPQLSGPSSAPVLEAASLYRGYVDAANAALRRTGHRSDTILIGELAPEGDERSLGHPVPPIPFLRALYCVGRDYRPLAGIAATALGCPDGGPRSAFVAAHPGLFAARGFAHHPYSFFLPPAARMSDPNFVPLSNLNRLEHGLDAIFAAYSVARRLPVYLTEYGYETFPPNPFRGVSPARQAAYLDQAEYMAWRDPRVRTLSQFLLYDSAPDRSYPRGSVGYWSTFQTGLVYLDGAPKPSLYSYRLPIFVPDPVFTRGRRVTVWGMLRLAPNRTRQRALVQWRPSAGAWRSIAAVTTSNRTGVLLTRLALPGTGAVRLEWKSSAGQVAYSRSVGVRAAG